MKNKLLISCVIIMLGILAFGTISASAATEGIYTYSVSGGEATITDFSDSASGDIAIPSTLGGYPVTSIGESVFYNCTSLTSVNITDIAAWCNISFSDSYSNPLLYAKNLYLNGELVTDLVIPEGVTSIGKWAFYNCTSLTSVTIGNSVTSIGSDAFCDCSNLESVYINDIGAWCKFSFYD